MRAAESIRKAEGERSGAGSGRGERLVAATLIATGPPFCVHFARSATAQEDLLYAQRTAQGIGRGRMRKMRNPSLARSVLPRRQLAACRSERSCTSRLQRDLRESAKARAQSGRRAAAAGGRPAQNVMMGLMSSPLFLQG